MFTDGRGKKIILVSHCILNQNSISDGTADFPGVLESILELIARSGAGIIQMPCPELLCLGLDRGDIRGGERAVIAENTRIRHDLEKPDSAVIIDHLTDQVIFQIEEYLHNGFTVLGIVGVDRSPSCGILTTSKNDQEVQGEGVFIGALKKKLKNKGIDLKLVGIKTSEMDKAYKSVQSLIEGQ